MTDCRKRTTESKVYAMLWIIVVGLYLLDSMRHRAQVSDRLLDMGVVYGMARTVLPFFVLFIINNELLLPRLLLKNRWKAYVAVTVCLLAALWCYEYFMFMDFERSMPIRHGRPHDGYRPLLPMPVLLDFTYGLLVIGVNLAITLLFQRYYDKLEQESLQKANAEHQLAFLKAQINPHFYLNMLNNIHGMIDIDPEKAQTMLIDMSRLMRFMLYDSAKPRISLAEEAAFLDNYLKLMRQRYPADRVAVTWNFPGREQMSGITLPPLLFLSFIENAFKHGVSFREQSFVAVSIEIEGGTVRFKCMNSVPSSANATPGESSGIGLKNVKERLRLIYGSRADLVITDVDNKYVVSLTIPINDTEDADN